MDSLFAKIKERLEEKMNHSFNQRYKAFAESIEIVNQVAEETNKGEISDGYHTFNELYHHRAILFSVICNSNKELAWKSRLHDTGDMYDGMFIVGIETPEGQATYHYDIEPYWDMFEVKKLQNAPKWDGHTPDEAIRRIGLLGKDINTSSNDGCISLPKVAFDRMIARMESESERDIYEEESLFINVRDAARIVHEIVKEHSDSENPNMSENLTSSDEFCEWRLCDEEANVYDTACGNSEMLFDGSPIDNNYSFCSYCGKKIKLLECTKCKWYWQNNDTENECSGYPTTCCEYVETAPYQPKGENNA